MSGRLTNEEAQYATTHGTHIGGPPDDPTEPKGKGWMLIASAASGRDLYWTWERPLRCQYDEEAESSSSR